ncbi:hypothetical protein SAMN04488109_5562 [Chryseolinea serpens]|uniref:6-bladed beta-propeller protein n=1 Tax=Chryseolinea serpens TaxID=947013 RepID=A0A1M5W0B4_9BACT|nr:hypothetical protein SAMN04488109_5562 [Chryseolinea serpens]
MKTSACLSFALSLFLFCPNDRALGQPGQLFKLGSGKDVNRMPWRDSVYRFSQFQSAVVTYSNKFIHPASVCMNYNAYFEHMFLVDEKGDTLQLQYGPETRTIRMITLGDVDFLHDDRLGYIEVLSAGPVALGAKHNFVLVSTSRRVSVYDFRGERADYVREYKKDVEYFFIGRDNTVYPAFPPTMSKLFPAHKEAIKTFIDDHRINFKQEKDLLLLVDFCNAKATRPLYDTSELFFWPNGKNLSQLPWRKGVYRFTNFVEGRISYADNVSPRSVAALNYNRFTRKMMWIGPGNDTLSVDEAGNIRAVQLDSVLYHREPVRGQYLEVLMRGPVSLGVLETLRLMNRDLEREQLSAAGTIAYPKPQLGDRIYKKNVTYYFIDGSGNAYPATKDAALRLFRTHKKELSAYLHNNTIDYKNQSDLAALLSYCNLVLTKNH